jgi:amino acid transporter
MGKDLEVPGHFGLLHSERLTPHRAIWALAIISAAIGCVAVSLAFGDSTAPADSAIQGLPHNVWSSFGYSTHDKMAALPNSLLTITLASNFGTFLLYGLSCFTCLVAYHGHPNFSLIRHAVIPIFGLCANLACMAFYLIGPFLGYGTKMEPLLALGIACLWGIYGGVYFMRNSKQTGRPAFVQAGQNAARV